MQSGIVAVANNYTLSVFINLCCTDGSNVGCHGY